LSGRNPIPQYREVGFAHWLMSGLHEWCAARRRGEPCALTGAFAPLPTPNEEQRPLWIIHELERTDAAALPALSAGIVQAVRNWRLRLDGFDVLEELLWVAWEADPPGIVQALDELIGRKLPLVKRGVRAAKIVDLTLEILRDTVDTTPATSALKRLRASPYWRVDMVPAFVMASVGLARDNWTEAFAAWRKDVEGFFAHEPEAASRQFTEVFASITLAEVAGRADAFVDPDRLAWLARLVFDSADDSRAPVFEFSSATGYRLLLTELADDRSGGAEFQPVVRDELKSWLERGQGRMADWESGRLLTNVVLLRRGLAG
jgi:hypothetical protein